jgi:ABC-type nitrate/sulfonate/bicarbonate transport system permease component
VIVGVVVSEMPISSAAIGYLISRYRTILDSPHVFAGVLLVLATALSRESSRTSREVRKVLPGADVIRSHRRRPK